MADLKFLPANFSHWILSRSVSIDCFLAHIFFLHVLSILGTVHSWMIYIVEPLDFVVLLWRILIFFFFKCGQLTNVRLQTVSLVVNSHRNLCLVRLALGGLLAQKIGGQQQFVQSLCTECVARPPIGSCFLAKSSNHGKLARCHSLLPKADSSPAFASLVTLCCLWTAAFYILFRIYSCYVHKDYQKPIPFLFWACLYLMFFFFFFFSIYHLFSLPGPLRAVLLVPRVSQPLLKVTPILIVVIKSKETERGWE